MNLVLVLVLVLDLLCALGEFGGSMSETLRTILSPSEEGRDEGLLSQQFEILFSKLEISEAGRLMKPFQKRRRPTQLLNR